MSRLLVVSHTAGFRHSAIETGEKVLTDLANQSGNLHLDFCRNADDVSQMLTPEYLKDYDGVVFNNTTGDLGIPDLPAFLDWIAGGKAFIGAHAASDTYHNQPAFLEMVGGEFITHGQQCEVDIVVENAEHPAVAHLSSPYRIFEEIYELKATREGKTVLLSLDKHPPDGHAEAGEPSDFLLAWTKEHGRGRVFYTGLGHREDIWESAPFQQHLSGGMQWALGR
jgi:type 1 glutamine amidotransferase